MTALIIAMTKQAVAEASADRKGVTALEYALIAAAVAGIVLAAFNGLFTKLQTFISGINFAAPT